MRKPISRRQFVKTTMATAGIAALGEMTGCSNTKTADGPNRSPNQAPAKVFGANDRINIGCIGIGGMGTEHLNSLLKRGERDGCKVVAVCDVYQRRLSVAKEKSKADAYTDYRKVLDRQDIDAVLIATPDHWHAKLSIDAMASGKHVFCEKPMTHTIEQALAVRDAVKRYKKVFQVGPQATGDDRTWKAREAIKAGRIGKVTWAQASYNRNFRVCMFNTYPEPVNPAVGPDKSGDDHVDWDMWLGYKWGLAPKIPWNGEHFFHFRKFWPYNGGVATDLLYHKLAPLLLAIAGPDGEYPLRVNASGGLYIEKDGRDIPDVFIMTADYPSEFTIMLVSTLTNDTQIPTRIYGKNGTMDLDKEGLVMEGNGEMKEDFKAKNGGQDKVEIAREPRRDMELNFLAVIRGQDNTLHCNVNLGTTTMVAIKMAVESYRQRKTLKWDAKAEKVVTA